MPQFLLLLLLSLFLTRPAAAEWSPEILLWQNPPDAEGSNIQAAVQGDSSGTAHIVYSHVYRIPSNPLLPRVGLRYTRFNASGQELGPPLFLSDSLHYFASRPQIQFYGQDSLCVLWLGGPSSPSRPARRYAVLDLAGHLLQPQQELPRVGGFHPDGRFAAAIRPTDRALCYADANGRHDSIRVIVQQPDGQRMLDDAVIWNEWPADQVVGYLDHTDSLQLFWRQFPSWNAIYATRVDTRTPFDPARRGTHVVVSPHTLWVASWAQPWGDSLIALQAGTGDVTGYSENLWLLRRADYAHLWQYRLGRMNATATALGLEGDSVFSYVTLDTAAWATIRHRRVRLWTGEVLEDSVVAVSDPEWGSGIQAYHVGPDGSRHLIYWRWRGTGPGSYQLWYRYWRENLAVEHPPSAPPALFTTVFPNPFNSASTIRYRLARTAHVRLGVYDLVGREVAVLTDELRTAGEHAVRFEATGLASGIYFVRLQAGPQSLVQKIALVR